MRKAVGALVVAFCLSIISMSALAGSVMLGHGLGFEAPLLFEIDDFSHLDVVWYSRSYETPSPDLTVSETPIEHLEQMRGVLYGWRVGPGLRLGAGVVHTIEAANGALSHVGGAKPEMVSVPISNVQNWRPIVRATVELERGRSFQVVDLKATSLGVAVEARAGMAIDKLRVGVGYRQGFADWWSGPFAFLGATF